MGKKSGLLTMVFSVLGIVMVASMFNTILTSLGTLLATAGASDFLVLSTVIGLVPTILLLTMLGGGAYGFYKGQKATGEADASGLIRIVFGALMVILFVAMFGTVLTSMHLVWANAGDNGTVDNTSVWIALRTVSSIMPTILFLGGIFAGVATSVSGVRSRRRRGRMI